MSDRSRVVRTGARVEDNTDSPGRRVVFALIMTACVIVDVSLVALLIKAVAQFAGYLSPAVIAGLFCVAVLAVRVVADYRATVKQLRAARASVQSAKT